LTHSNVQYICVLNIASVIYTYLIYLKYDKVILILIIKTVNFLFAFHKKKNFSVLVLIPELKGQDRNGTFY